MEKNYVFQYETDMGHYVAEVFAVRCFDDRFREAFEAFMAAQGIKRFDPESVAGGGKIISLPEKETDMDFMMRELEKSIRLHHTRKVMIYTHRDCGAYGGSGNFESEDAEFAFHVEQHNRAASILKERFPDLSVETYFIDKDGIVKTSS